MAFLLSLIQRGLKGMSLLDICAPAGEGFAVIAVFGQTLRFRPQI
jgi:hypothetical protein